jgi:AraC family transcriptional regulator
VSHPFCPGRNASFQSFEEYDRQVQIQELDDFVVICERYIGNYIELGKNWSAFTEKYRDYIKADTLLIERYFDDPTITSVDQCLYDLCMTVDKSCSMDQVTAIQGGKFAVYRFDGPVADIFPALQGMFGIWLAGGGYEMDERYGLNIYWAVDRETMRVIMDLCIPVK